MKTTVSRISAVTAFIRFAPAFLVSSTVCGTEPYWLLEQELEDGTYRYEGVLAVCEREFRSSPREALAARLRAARDRVLNERASGALAQLLSLSGGAEVAHIGLVGEDGAGKTTLIRRFVTEDSSRLWLEFSEPVERHYEAVMGRIQSALQSAPLLTRLRTPGFGIDLNALRTTDRVAFFRLLNRYSRVLNLRIGVIGQDLLHHGADEGSQQWILAGLASESSSLSTLVSGAHVDRRGDYLPAELSAYVQMPTFRRGTGLLDLATEILIEAGYSAETRDDLRGASIVIARGLSMSPYTDSGALRNLTRLMDEWIRLADNAVVPPAGLQRGPLTPGLERHYASIMRHNTLEAIDDFVNEERTGFTPYGYIYLEGGAEGAPSRSELLERLKSQWTGSRSTWETRTEVANLPIVIDYEAGMDVDRAIIDATRAALVANGHVPNIDAVPDDYAALFRRRGERARFSLSAIGVRPIILVHVPPHVEDVMSLDEMIALVGKIKDAEVLYGFGGGQFRYYLILSESQRGLGSRRSKAEAQFHLGGHTLNPTFRISGR